MKKGKQYNIKQEKRKSKENARYKRMMTKKIEEIGKKKRKVDIIKKCVRTKNKKLK